MPNFINMILVYNGIYYFQYLYIGKNESMREGFVGCISRVEFDEIIPLKLYFQVK